jgi:hypothetical protein
MKDNYFHGQGTMYYPDGRVESGRWEYDKLVNALNNIHIKSTIIIIIITKTIQASDPGCVYGDCANGYGKYEWANGDYYIGNFMSRNVPQGRRIFLL